MGPAYPVSLAAADLSRIACATDTAGYLPPERTVRLLVIDACLAAPFFQFLSRKEDFFFDDGRMGSLRIVLLAFPMIPDLPGWKGVRGVGLLPEGVTNIPFIGEDIRDGAVNPSAVF